MKTIDTIRQYAKELNLTAMAAGIDSLLENARMSQTSYTEFTFELLDKEMQSRRAANMARRTKVARLPMVHDLDLYDAAAVNGVALLQLRELRELLWLDQKFNLMLIGPSGIGKSFIAAGLCFDSLKNGYHGLFRTMDQLTRTIRLKDLSVMEAREYKRLVNADLLVIDDIMMFPLEKDVAVGMFQLINQLHEKTSFIITTNKNPKAWAEMLGDEVLATAILDRLLYKCEILQMQGKSYRFENRKTIFGETKKTS